MRQDPDAFLNVDDAAVFCGFTASGYRNPRMAFLKWVRRHAVPRGYVGRNLRFRRSHLERAIQPTTKERTA